VEEELNQVGANKHNLKVTEKLGIHSANSFAYILTCPLSLLFHPMRDIHAINAYHITAEDSEVHARRTLKKQKEKKLLILILDAHS
jgi:hypothetical protein